jgi:Ca2+-binding EF-hand superfamily protein
MTISLISITALAASLALQSAQPSTPSLVERIRADFTAIDANRDGRISDDEYRRFVYAAFADADRNGDAGLSRTEFRALDTANDTELSTFASIDDNGDGSVSIGEFMKLQRLLFDFADLDRDGAVSENEYIAVALAVHHGWVDADGDHRLDRDEYAAAIIRAFGASDVDRSGTLDAAEAGAFDASLGAIDAPTFLDREFDRLPAGLR